MIVVAGIITVDIFKYMLYFQFQHILFTMKTKKEITVTFTLSRKNHFLHPRQCKT
jgi:hypothetical protein